ncbi:hypothetical protein [Truepera radiovictrix]|uniref:Uncharacterized protein n=1 Tax=Truepera radiovictrix (strain DSM 17093 / CIP 108686 / LMG 22925 / RQ-24) TaxID=649638 RepID=D7CUS2_TRURR|nr:hypothetical protein [Truepera radiovictrix]ADI14063.1 conserved hypothetical protein [Truepera radiovictrix DSM 17093]WMT57375.1 hypothetical protein RCV51_00160 [Truepera radiovictrix]
MSDELGDVRNPIGLPMEDGAADEGEATEEDYEELERMDEALSDAPYEEEGVAYDPAKQAPKEAER